MTIAKTKNINRNSNRLLQLRSKTNNSNKMMKKTKKLINKPMITVPIKKPKPVKHLTMQKRTKKKNSKKTKCHPRSSKKCAKATLKTLSET